MKKMFASWLALLLALSVVLPTPLAVLANENTVVVASEQTVELELSQSLFSLTEARTAEVTVDFGEKVDLTQLQWELGGKSFDEWKKWSSEESFLHVTKEPEYVADSTTIKAEIKFDLPYGTSDLSNRTIRVLYPELLGNYELALIAPDKEKQATTTIKLNVYDEYLAYEEIKPEIDRIFAEANNKNDRYLEYKKLGESVEGRDIHFVVLARDEAAVTKYLDGTLPQALENPAALLEKVANGTIGDYQVPIWFNNIHPDEVEGVDAQTELLKKFALENEVTFNTQDEDGTESSVTLDVEDLLDHVIFLFNFTHNPDGRVANTRANALGFDLNRDNAYQTQVETIAVNEEIAKWTPISFLDLHGYVKGFLIEPGTPPHNPNFEYDLLIDNMLGQAHAMGRTGVANSNEESYLIPLLDWGNGWDDMTPAYTAIFAMLHGSLGHTIEVPTLSQDSLYAMVGTGLGATQFVVENKDELFTKQLQLFKRGIDGEDNRAVDQWYVNQAGEEIGRVRGDNENFFPNYYVIPFEKENQKNLLEASNMVEYLLRNGIQVEETTKVVTVDGTTYPVGTYIVPMNQAKRGLANAVLYSGDNVSDWEAMYDPIVVNFPALRGFSATEIRVQDAFTGKTKEVSTVKALTPTVTTSADKQILANSNNDVVKVINDLLAKGKDVQQVTEAGNGYNKGDYLVQTSDLLAYTNSYVLDATPVTGAVKTVQLTKPKVAFIGSGQAKFTLQELGFDLVDQADAEIIVHDQGALSLEVLQGKDYIGMGGRAVQALQGLELLEGLNYETTRLSHEGLVRADLADHFVTAGYSANEFLYTATGTWITEVPEGAEVLATVANEENFYVAGWWPGHEGAKGQTLAFTQELDGSTYTLFANDLAFRAHTQHSYRLLANSIFASASTAVTEQPSFSDVSATHWAKKEIDFLVQAGIINGYKDGTFKPSQKLNRGQAAELLAKALELDVPAEVTQAPFADVSINNYYAAFATAVKEAEIFTGNSKNEFGAKDEMTREQMASILVRALDLKDTGAKVDIKDLDNVSASHKENVRILAQHGLTTESQYRPKDSVNRAQFATFLYRALNQ